KPSCPRNVRIIGSPRVPPSCSPRSSGAAMGARTMGARSFSSEAAAWVYDAADAARSEDDLDAAGRALWRHYGQGCIGEEDAGFLQTFIAGRRTPGHSSPHGHLKPVERATGGVLRRVSSRFKPRGRQGSPDRKASRERRRTLGGSSVLPPDLRCNLRRV